MVAAVVIVIKVSPKPRSELPPAITSIATHQISLVLPTTHTAVMGAVSRPVIAADSIYRCARILKIHDPCWKGLVENMILIYVPHSNPLPLEKMPLNPMRIPMALG